MFYVLIQKGICIFGIGTSKDDTLKSVCDWTDIETPEEIDYTESYNSADEATFVLIECTERLYTKIAMHGSCLYEVEDNIADIYNQ